MSSVVDVTPNDDLRTLIDAATPGTSLMLHGEFIVGQSLQMRRKTGVLLNADDATVSQPLYIQSQFGDPILRLSGCADCAVVGGRWIGANEDCEFIAGRVGCHGISIGGGSVDITVQDAAIEKVYGDLIFVGSFAGSLLKGRTHNERIALLGIEGFKAGRHAFTVRDCIGYRLAGAEVRAVNRMFFDHEPAKWENFSDAVIEGNVSPEGGIGWWFQMLPSLTSTCANITVQDHTLTRGSFHTKVMAGYRPRAGLTFQRLHRAPENPTPPWAKSKPLLDISKAWSNVVISDVEP